MSVFWISRKFREDFFTTVDLYSLPLTSSSEKVRLIPHDRASRLIVPAQGAKAGSGTALPDNGALTGLALYGPLCSALTLNTG